MDIFEQKWQQNFGFFFYPMRRYFEVLLEKINWQ